jgi:hypothetical protein
LPVGARGTLEVERIALKLPFVALARERDILHLRFDLNPATATRLAELVNQLALPLAAWRQAIDRYRHAAAKRW